MKAFALLLLSVAAAAQAPRTTILPNRLPVAIREDFGGPLVRVRLAFSLPLERSALAAFALEVLDHSATGSHSRGSFGRALDHAGLSLERILEAESVTWVLEGPPQGLDAGLALLADQVLRPQIDGAAVERARLRLFRDLQAQSPGQRALRRARARLGASEGLPADEILLSQTGEGEIEGFLRELLRPGRGVLTIEGAVAEPQARTAALLHFGTWPEGAPAAPAPAADPHSRLTLVPGGAPNAWLGVNLAGTSRAFREILALAAPSSSPSGADLEIHSRGFALHRGGGNPLDALEALRGELDAFARKGLEAGELDAAKRRFAATIQTRGLHPAARGLWEPGVPGLAAEVAGTDLAAFNETLRKAFEDPRNRAAVLVGLAPKDGVDPRLAAYGDPEVWFEGRGAFLRRGKAKTE